MLFAKACNPEQAQTKQGCSWKTSNNVPKTRRKCENTCSNTVFFLSEVVVSPTEKQLLLESRRFRLRTCRKVPKQRLAKLQADEQQEDAARRRAEAERIEVEHEAELARQEGSILNMN